MGQISNILTLRRQQKSLDLLSSESKSFLYTFNFVNTFKRSVNKKRSVNNSISF